MKPVDGPVTGEVLPHDPNRTKAGTNEDDIGALVDGVTEGEDRQTEVLEGVATAERPPVHCTTIGKGRLAAVTSTTRGFR